MDEKALAMLAKSVQETVQKELPGLVLQNMEEIKKSIGDDVEKVKSELKEFSTAMAAASKGKGGEDEAAELARKSFVCSVLRATAKGVAFDEATTLAKAAFMNGNVASGEGAELVFDQFLEDILYVISTYRVIEDITLYNIIKGDNLKIPKVVSALTTAWVAE